MREHESMIKVSDLALTVGGSRRLFSGLSWEMKSGSVTAVLGPSGVGKTTFLGALAGFIHPNEGVIVLEQGALVAWAQQNSPILPKRSVHDNVALGAECRGIEEEVARSRAMRVLGSVGLEELAHLKAGRLSGGERQRAALARALASEAKIILVDEPTASLDVTSKKLVVKAIQATANMGSCVVVATHDHVVALAADSTIDLLEFAERESAR